MATARRHGLPLTATTPTARLDEVTAAGDLLVAVCDNAWEEIGGGPGRLHWSVPDPVPAGTTVAFERVFGELADRVDRLVPAVSAPAGTPATEQAPSARTRPPQTPSQAPRTTTRRTR